MSRHKGSVAPATPVALGNKDRAKESALAKERKALVEAALSALSAPDREILTRFFLYEQSQDEICAELKLTDTQFRLLKSRAKARFGKLGQPVTTGKSPAGTAAAQIAATKDAVLAM